MVSTARSHRQLLVETVPYDTYHRQRAWRITNSDTNSCCHDLTSRVSSACVNGVGTKSSASAPTKLRVCRVE
jgi:hypothetical protein